MLEKVFTTSEVHFLFSTMCFQNVTEKWQLSHERFCKTLLKQMLSCSNIQQSATPACTRDAHSFIAGPVLQPPAHVEAFNTTPLWKKPQKPALSLFLIWFYQQLERWLKAGTKISAQNKRQNPTLLPLSQEQHCRPEQEAQGHHKNFAAVFVPATPQPHILESPRSKQLCCLFCRTKIQKQGQTRSRGCAKSLLWMSGEGCDTPQGTQSSCGFQPGWHKSQQHSLAGAPQCEQNPHSCTSKYRPRALHLCITVEITSLEQCLWRHCGAWIILSYYETQKSY